MMGYKKSIFERQSLSKVKLGRGSLNCKDLWLQIMKEKNSEHPEHPRNAESCVLKTLIKRFQGSGHTSESILNAWDLFRPLDGTASQTATIL